jgi:3-hydroxyacyl-CoA dehydrogenase
MPDSPVVRLEKDGDIGVIIVNYPPVNALGPGVSEGIIECLGNAYGDPSIKAILLMGDGRSFIAGADIRGFDANRKRTPIGERTYDVMDRSDKPIVAAIPG